LKSFRVLVFTSILKGTNGANVFSAHYKEYVALSKKVKLILMTPNPHEINTPTIRIIPVRISKGMPTKFKNALRFVFAMIKIRQEFDIVFTRMMGNHYLIPAIVAKLFFRKKFILFISGAGKVFKIKENKFNRQVVKIALALADKVGTHSPIVIDDFEFHLGYQINKKKLFFLNHYVDINKFSPTKINVTENVVISTGRIVPIKGIEILIQAIPHILKKTRGIKIKIIGPHPGKKYYDKMLNLVKSLGCEDEVEFVGPIPHNKISEWLNKGKVFVSTSKAIGVSTSIAEAMACGLPVVSTSPGSIPSIDKEYCPNGYIIPAEPVLIADKISDLLNDDVLRQKISKNSRMTAQIKFNGTTFIEKLYQEIVT